MESLQAETPWQEKYVFFPNLYLFSLDESVLVVVSDSCSWLTGVEPDMVSLKQSISTWILHNTDPTFLAD